MTKPIFIEAAVSVWKIGFVDPDDAKIVLEGVATTNIETACDTADYIDEMRAAALGG